MTKKNIIHRISHWASMTSLALLLVGLPARLTVAEASAAAIVQDSPTVTLLSADPDLRDPGAITTDGVNLYVTGSNASGTQSIFRVPIDGGAATRLYPAFNPNGLAVIGANVFWIDPNGDPDATAIFRAPLSGSGPVMKIYSGFATGQPIVDGVGLTTDGVRLYTADDVQGRVHGLNSDGSGLAQLGSMRYAGFFDTEHRNTIAEYDGVLYVADSGKPGVIAPQVVSIPTTGATSFTPLHVGAPFVQPVDIAVGNGTIFVADAGAGNTIWSLPTSGGTPTAVVAGSPFVEISGLTFFNDALYVTDTGGSGPGAIYRVDLCGTPPEVSVVSIHVGSGVGGPGQETAFDVRLDSLGQEVAAAQVDIGFDPRAAVKAKANGHPDCAVNPDINKDGTAFAFLPPGCTPGVNCRSIRAIVFSLEDVERIPDGSTLFTCTAAIAADADDGRYPLVCSTAGGSDPTGHPLSSLCADGVITVDPTCAGDCDGDDGVTVDELVKGVSIAIGAMSLGQCPSFDRNADGSVTVDELVTAVGEALNGCTAVPFTR